MMQGSLAERLRVLRAQDGLTLNEASAKIGINRHTLRDLELGKREPYGPTIRKIAEAYNVSLAQLLEEPALASKADASSTGRPESKGPDPDVWGPEESRPKPSIPGSTGKHIHVEIGGGEAKVTERSFLDVFRDICEGRIASEEEALQRLLREDRKRSA